MKAAPRKKFMKLLGDIIIADCQNKKEKRWRKEVKKEEIHEPEEIIIRTDALHTGEFTQGTGRFI